jgi:hypothetical protein
MKKLNGVLIVIVLGVLGFISYKLGWILIKVFIGLMFMFVFALGVLIGRFTKK